MFTMFLICDGQFFVTQQNLEAFSICLFTVMFSNISFSLDKKASKTTGKMDKRKEKKNNKTEKINKNYKS